MLVDGCSYMYSSGEISNALRLAFSLLATQGLDLGVVQGLPFEATKQGHVLLGRWSPKPCQLNMVMRRIWGPTVRWYPLSMYMYVCIYIYGSIYIYIYVCVCGIYLYIYMACIYNIQPYTVFIPECWCTPYLHVFNTLKLLQWAARLYWPLICPEIAPPNFVPPHFAPVATRARPQS